MVHPLFVDFFYTLWGKVIIYLLFMVIPLLLHIKTEHTNWRRPISTTLLLSLWIFVDIFERDISDCSWLVWCWMISSLVLGMFSTFLMGPLFVEERYVNRPGIYWVSSIFSASIITSIYIVGSDSIWSILYTMAILILHYIAYGTDRMSYIPIFSVITTYIMWYYCDFSVWYLTIGFSVSVILLAALNITSFTYYESSRKKEEDKEKYAFFEFIITVLVLIFNAYLVLSNTPLTHLVEEYPYLGLFYLILCLAVLLINDVAFCIAAGIVSIAYIGYFWSIFYLPKLFLHLPSLTFSWPNITWNWDLFTFTWCSIIMWIGISILVLAIIISSYITLANYPKRFRAITVLFSFALVPILLFFVKNDSLNWTDWTCLIISFLITFVLFGFEANLEDDERDEGYFITRVGSLIIMGYLLYLCHSLKADFTFDYRHLCLVVCILGMYNIVNLPYCIGFWIVSIGYFAISFCDLNFSLPNISFELSWNWDLFSFTWCSVIMWIFIAIYTILSIAALFVVPKQFRAATIPLVFIAIPILLFGYKENSLNWIDWTCFVVTLIITIILFCIECEIEDEERKDSYFITRIGSFFTTLYLLYLCYSLHGDFPFDYRYFCMAVCVIGVYNIINLPYCIVFWLGSVGYFAISLCDVHFSLPSFSFDLSWNWDLFSFTWYSVLMWGCIGLLLLTILCIISIVIRSKNKNKSNESQNNSYYHPIIPTEIEAALIAEHVYGKSPNSKLIGGWKVCKDFNRIIDIKSSTGLLSKIYKKTEKGNSCVGYVYAYAGTKSFTNAKDWANNIGQTAGWAPQYETAYKNSITLKSHIPLGDTLTFVGHSLGGGLAALSAMANSGTKAITFNAAGVSMRTQNKHNAFDESEITAIIAEGDPLDLFQRAGDWTQYQSILNISKFAVDIRPANGNRREINTLTFGIEAHQINSIIRALKMKDSDLPHIFNIAKSMIRIGILNI